MSEWNGQPFYLALRPSESTSFKLPSQSRQRQRPGELGCLKYKGSGWEG